MVEALKQYFGLRASGNVITRLSVMRSTVLKDTFGTADSEKFKSAAFKTEVAFQAAMTTTVEDHMLEVHKLIINKWRDSAFPLGVKDDGAAHKEPLRALLYDPELTKILAGFVPQRLFPPIASRYTLSLRPTHLISGPPLT
eukprot:2196589-Rhodomonas_salina.1